MEIPMTMAMDLPRFHGSRLDPGVLKAHIDLFITTSGTPSIAKLLPGALSLAMTTGAVMVGAGTLTGDASLVATGAGAITITP